MGYKFDDWDTVPEKNDWIPWNRLPAGGYICQIVQVDTKTTPTGDRLDVCLDVAEGTYKNFFLDKAQTLSSVREWVYDAIFSRYMSKGGKVSPYFKGFITVVQQSNPRFVFNPADWRPESLVGCMVGGIFGEREYRGRDGRLKVATSINSVVSTGKIRTGDFTVPPIKKLEDDGKAIVDSLMNHELLRDAREVDNVELPF